MMGEWGWRPLAALAGGLLAACAPPAFTTRVVEGSVSRTLWDNEPYEARLDNIAQVERTIKILIRLNGKDTHANLLAELTAIGGQCSESARIATCVIDRRIVKEDCGRGQCSRTAREWTLTVSWAPRAGPVDPHVRLALKIDRFNAN